MRFHSVKLPPPRRPTLTPEAELAYQEAVQRLAEEAESEAAARQAAEAKMAQEQEAAVGDPKKRLEWLRRASSRRLQPARQAGSAEENTVYEPVYVVPRPQSPDLPFEIMEEDLDGRVVLLPGPESRQRERFAIAAGCVFSVLLASSVAARMLSPEGVGEAGMDSPGAVLASHEAKLMAEVREDASRVPAARSAVEGFLKAATPREKVAFVRGGEAMLPAMERHYAGHADESPVFHAEPQAAFGYHAGRAFVMITGAGETGQPVETMVELTPEGPKVDWRFLTGAGDMEWAEWIQARPQVPVTMRAEAVLDDYYAGPFSDSSEWLCLKLTSPDRLRSVWAYVERKSESGVSIYRQLNQRRGTVRLAGEFSFPAQIHPGSRTAPQVQMVRAATEGWMDHSQQANRNTKP